MDALVPPHLAGLLDDERALLVRLRDLLRRTDADPETVDPLGDLIAHLDALFLVVVVGEFNAGKSSVLNALFGERIMEEGPIPTTAKITLLRHGAEPMERQLSDYLVERRHPAPLLEAVQLVDTPGTNSIIREHQRITEDFIPRADLVLFITSYDRPLTESERQFLTFIRDVWGKRLVFVLNKADLARGPEALAQVLEHIRSGCRELMDFEPEIFPVSAELAFAAKETAAASARETLWRESRFGPLEDYIVHTLAGPERVRLKLGAPLDTAARLLDGLGSRLGARRTALQEDEETLAALQASLDDARATLAADYERHLAEIDTLLLEMERRGVQFLDDTIRVGKIGLLRDRDRFKEEFNRQVVRDTDRQIEAHLTDAVDALLKRALSLWNHTLSDFGERVRRRGRRQQALLPQDFAYNRAEVFAVMQREAARKIETYDLREEARRILENAREAASLFQYTEAGAVGLGALAGVLVATTALDAVGGAGLVTAGAVAVAGFAYLPRQRRKAVAELKSQTEALRNALRGGLRTQFEQQVEAALDNIRETTAPYADLVARERDTLADADAEQVALRAELDRLRTAVADAVPPDGPDEA